MQKTAIDFGFGDVEVTPRERLKHALATPLTAGDEELGQRAYFISREQFGIASPDGAPWNQNRPFGSGREFFLKMREINERGNYEPVMSEGLKAYRAVGDDFEARYAHAKKGLGRWEGIKTAIVDSFEIEGLSDEQRGGADAETLAADDEYRRIFKDVNTDGVDRYFSGPWQDEIRKREDERKAWKTGEGAKKLEAFKTRWGKQQVIGEYEAKLAAENLWSQYQVFRPDLSERGDSLVQDIFREGKMTEGMAVRFGALPLKEQQAVAYLAHQVQLAPDATAWGFTVDLVSGFFKTAVRTPVNALHQVMVAPQINAYLDQEEANRYWQTRALLSQALEPKLADYGFIAESVIGVASTIPYMAYAAIPYGGMAMVALDAMQQFDDRVAAAGGEITGMEYTVKKAAVGLAYAGVERLQFKVGFGKLTAAEKRIAFAHAFKNLENLKTVLWEVGKSGLAETHEEMIQAALEEGFVAAGVDKDVARSALKGYLDESRTWLTMLMTAGIGGARKGVDARLGGAYNGEELADYASRRLRARGMLAVKDGIALEDVPGQWREIEKNLHGLRVMYHNELGGDHELALERFKGMGFSDEDAGQLVSFFDMDRDFYLSASVSPAERNQFMAAILGAQDLLRKVIPDAEITPVDAGTFTIERRVNGKPVRVVVRTSGQGAELAEDIHTPAFAASVEEVTRGQFQAGRRSFSMPAETYLAMTREERAAFVRSNNLMVDGRFRLLAPGESAGFSLMSEGGESVDGAALQVLTGEITLSPHAPSSVVFHEWFHAMTRVFRELGVLGEEDVAALAREFGAAAKGTDEIFNEEAGAEALRRYLLAHTDLRPASLWRKIVDGARALLGGIRRTQEAMAETKSAREQYFEQVLSGDWRGLPATAGVESEAATVEGGQGGDAAVESGEKVDSTPLTVDSQSAAQGVASAERPRETREVETVYRVVDAFSGGESLVLPGDREWQGFEGVEISDLDEDAVSKMALALDPARLLEAGSLNEGAPTVAGGGQLIAGHHRAAAIREAYRRNQAGAYERTVRTWADEHGVKIPKNVRHPILVSRVRKVRIGKHGSSNRVLANYVNGVAQADRARGSGDFGVSAMLESGLTPVLGYIHGNAGGIMSRAQYVKARGQRWLKAHPGALSFYDGAPGAGSLGPAARVLYDGGKQTPDQLAQQLADAGLIADAYVDTLWDAIKGEVEAYRRFREGAQDEADFAAYREGQDRRFANTVISPTRRAREANGVLIRAGSLQPGDVVTVRVTEKGKTIDEDLLVEGVSPDGGVRLLGGDLLGEQVVNPGATLHVAGIAAEAETVDSGNPAVQATGEDARYQLSVGDDLSNPEKAQALRDGIVYRQIPDGVLLDRHVKADKAAQYFIDNILGKTFITPQGKTFTANHGHFFRFVCASVSGQRKGFIQEAVGGKHALELVANGKAESLPGYEGDRASLLPLLSEIIEAPSVILDEKETSPLKQLHVLGYKTSHGNHVVVSFRDVGTKQIGPLTLHRNPLKDALLKKYDLAYLEADEVNRNTLANPAASDRLEGNARGAIPLQATQTIAQGGDSVKPEDDARLSLRLESNLYDPKSWLTALAARELIAGGKGLTEDQLRTMAANIGHPGLDVEGIGEAAQAYAEKNVDDALRRVIHGGGDATAGLGQIASRLDYEAYLRRAVQEGARTDRQLSKAERRIVREQDRALQVMIRQAQGLDYEQMCRESGVDLPRTLLAIDSKHFGESLEKAGDGRNAEEAAGVGEGRTRGKGRKAESYADKIKRLMKGDVAALGDAEAFAQFILDGAQYVILGDSPHLTPGTIWRDPVAVKRLRETFRKALTDIAGKVLEPTKAQVVIQQRIGEMKSDRVETLRLQAASILASIQRNAVRQSGEALVDELARELRAATFTGAEFDVMAEDLRRKVTADVERDNRTVVGYMRMGEKALEGEQERLKGIIDRQSEFVAEKGLGGEKLADDQKTQYALRDLALLQKYGGLKNKLPGEILAAREEILGGLVQESAAHHARWYAFAERVAGLTDALTAAMTKGAYRQAEKEGMVGVFFDSHLGLISQRLRTLIAHSDGEVRARAERALEDVNILLGDGATDYNVYRIEQHKLFEAGIAQIYGKGGINAFYKHMDEAIPEGVSSKVSLQGLGGRMTYGQAIQLYLSIQQGWYEANVRTHRRQGQDQLIAGILTKEDLQFVNWVRAYYEQTREALSEANRQVTGMGIFSPDPLYAPVKMKPVKGGLKGTHRQWTPVPAVLTPRVANTRDFDETASVVHMLTDRIEQNALFLAYGQRGLVLRGVFGDANLQETIAFYHGERQLTQVREQVEQTLMGGKETKRSDGALGPAEAVRHLFAYTTLSWNMLTVMKQLMSFPVWGNEIGLGRLLHHMTHVDWDVVAEFYNSREFIARYKGGWSVETRELLANPRMNMLQKIAQLGMKGNEIADFLPGVWIAQGVYQDLREKYLNEGFSLEEAKRRAMTMSWNMIEQTQQSGRTENTASMYRNHGSIMKFVMQFANSPMQQAAYETAAFQRGRARGWDRQGRMEFFRAVVINHVMLPGLMGLATAVFKYGILGDEPKEGDAWAFVISMIMGQYGRLVFAGMLTETALTAALTGKHQAGMGALIPAEGTARILSQGAITAHDLLTLKTEDLQEDLFKLSKSFAAPIRHGSKMYENRFEKKKPKRKAR